MEDRDSVGLVAAFAVGAILGVGATLLLRPEPPLARRLARRLSASGKRLSRTAHRAAHGAGGAGEALTGAGREVLDQLRSELAELVGAAREQLAQEVYEQLRGGPHGARGGHRALRHRSRR